MNVLKMRKTEVDRSTMRIYALQHDPIVGIGVIENWLNENNYEIHMVRVDLNEPFPDLNSLDLLIILGGRMGAYEEELYPWISKEKEYIRMAARANKFILGICLGSQLIASALGGTAFKNKEPELGWHSVQIENDASSHPLLKNAPTNINFFEYHYDTFTLPDHACLIAKNSCSKQGFTIGDRILALQFHPEFNEGIVTFLKEKIYPKEVEGTFVQSITKVLKESNFEGSRKWMFQIMDNFKEQILIAKVV